jgi:tRNA A37 N6-isopentenylltransferase MiaA
MEKEVASLLATYGKHAPAVSALGYRSLATWERDERAYARRQMTWFRAIPGIRWFDVTSADYPGAVTRFVSAWYTGGNL